MAASHILQPLRDAEGLKSLRDAEGLSSFSFLTDEPIRIIMYEITAQPTFEAQLAEAYQDTNALLKLYHQLQEEYRHVKDYKSAYVIIQRYRRVKKRYEVLLQQQQRQRTDDIIRSSNIYRRFQEDEIDDQYYNMFDEDIY